MRLSSVFPITKAKKSENGFGMRGLPEFGEWCLDKRAEGNLMQQAVLAWTAHGDLRSGNPKLAAARNRAIEGNRAAATRYAANVLPVIREIQARGVKSLRGVARALAARGIATARGGELLATRLGRPKGVPRALCDQLSLMLRHGSQIMHRELGCVRVIDRDELHPGFHERGYEGQISG
jgi:hypothetical protein